MLRPDGTVKHSVRGDNSKSLFSTEGGLTKEKRVPVTQAPKERGIVRIAASGDLFCDGTVP